MTMKTILVYGTEEGIHVDGATQGPNLGGADFPAVLVFTDTTTLRIDRCRDRTWRIAIVRRSTSSLTIQFDGKTDRATLIGNDLNLKSWRFELQQSIPSGILLTDGRNGKRLAGC